jgi:hypothetical protein
MGKTPKVPFRRRTKASLELGQVLRKQTEGLESRTFGAATDTEILEYEIRFR